MISPFGGVVGDGEANEVLDADAELELCLDLPFPLSLVICRRFSRAELLNISFVPLELGSEGPNWECALPNSISSSPDDEESELESD